MPLPSAVVADFRRCGACVVREASAAEPVVGLSGRRLIALHDLALPLFERPAASSPGNLREPVREWTGVRHRLHARSAPA